MTEQPDTAAVRALYQLDCASDTDIRALCDALDAAREDADMMGRAYDAASEEREALVRAVALLQARAEAADAAHRRMEDAEARIAAALEMCATTLTSPCDPHCRVIDIRRALTGGTR